MVVHCVSVILTAYILLFWFTVAEESGPYSVVLKTVKNCEDKGTGEMTLISTARKDKSGKIFHTGDINMPYGLNDDLEAEGDATIWENGQWKPVSLFWKLRLPNACSSTKSLVGYWFDILKAANVKTKCPIPKGKYHFVNYHVSGSLKGIPSLKYGKYRARFHVKNKKGKIGCVAYIAQVVPAK